MGKIPSLLQPQTTPTTQFKKRLYNVIIFLKKICDVTLGVSFDVTSNSPNVGWQNCLPFGSYWIIKLIFMLEQNSRFQKDVHWLGQTTESNRREQGSIPGQSMWDLWRIKWWQEGVFSRYFSFPLSVSFHHCSILIHPSTTHTV